MYSLLWAYKVAIPTEDMVSLEDLKNLQQQYTIDTVRHAHPYPYGQALEVI
jgi:hypothetical protein